MIQPAIPILRRRTWHRPCSPRSSVEPGSWTAGMKSVSLPTVSLCVSQAAMTINVLVYSYTCSCKTKKKYVPEFSLVFPCCAAHTIKSKAAYRGHVTHYAVRTHTHTHGGLSGSVIFLFFFSDADVRHGAENEKCRLSIPFTPNGAVRRQSSSRIIKRRVSHAGSAEIHSLLTPSSHDTHTHTHSPPPGSP